MLNWYSRNRIYPHHLVGPSLFIIKKLQMNFRKTVLLCYLLSVIDRPKCILAASHAATWWVTLSRLPVCAAGSIKVRKKDGTNKWSDIALTRPAYKCEWVTGCTMVHGTAELIYSRSGAAIFSRMHVSTTIIAMYSPRFQVTIVFLIINILSSIVFYVCSFISL